MIFVVHHVILHLTISCIWVFKQEISAAIHIWYVVTSKLTLIFKLVESTHWQWKMALEPHCFKEQFLCRTCVSLVHFFCTYLPETKTIIRKFDQSRAIYLIFYRFVDQITLVQNHWYDDSIMKTPWAKNNLAQQGSSAIWDVSSETSPTFISPGLSAALHLSGSELMLTQ